MAVGTAVVAVVVVVIAHIITYLFNERSLLHKCLPKLPKCFFCSNRRLKWRPEQYWAFDTIDPDHLTTSFFAPLWLLAALRLLMAFYFAAGVVIEQYTTPNGLGDPKVVWISFFTDWTFCLLGASGLLGFLLTAWRSWARSKAARVRPDQEQGSRSSASPAAADPAGMQWQTAGPAAAAAAPGQAVAGGADAEPAALPVRRWTWIEAAYLLLLETSAASALFLTVFYWVALAGDSNLRADNIMKHGTNNVLILLDVFLSRVPFLSYHFQVALVYGTVYLVFMWAVWLPVKGYWVYEVFDWGRWRSLGAYAILPVALFVAFCIWTGIAALREAVGTRWPVRRWSSALIDVAARQRQKRRRQRQQEASGTAGGFSAADTAQSAPPQLSAGNDVAGIAGAQHREGDAVAQSHGGATPGAGEVEMQHRTVVQQ